MRFEKFSNPIMFVSDNPNHLTGLARIGRDLAMLTAQLPAFRVGYLARGIGNSRRFPFTVYPYPESGQWGEGYIQEAWHDFSNGEPGIIMSLDDLSRRHWSVNPSGLPENLAEWVNDRTLRQMWAYTPIDSVGPNGTTLPTAQADCARRFDRIIAASEFGRDVLVRSGVQNADWLPHGFLGENFHYKPDAKKILDWEGKVVVGCNMSNQARKDFPTLFEAAVNLRNIYGSKFRLWIHCDTLIRTWNLYALAHDYGIGSELEITTECNDAELAYRYSGCVCTILPSGGEGFGYPIVESMACGTPCVVTNYAAGPELVREECRVAPVYHRVETPHNVMRAVLSGTKFATVAQAVIDGFLSDEEYWRDFYRNQVEHLEWGKLKYIWQRWLLEGIQ